MLRAIFHCVARVRVLCYIFNNRCAVFIVDIVKRTRCKWNVKVTLISVQIVHGHFSIARCNVVLFKEHYIQFIDTILLLLTKAQLLSMGYTVY